MPSIKTECDSCDGTGLYVGFVEYGRGKAAVCATCSGTGCDVVEYKTWSGKRKQKRGIKIVTLAWGRGEPITYKEFLAGKRPAKKEDRRDA